MRMRTVLGGVIHPDQTCAVAGRKITDSLILVRDAICLARDRNLRLAIMNSDFEKAYDRVSHQYILSVLQKRGFPTRFLAWVGLLYTGGEKHFPRKWVSNGCSSSELRRPPRVPLILLYACCIEPLADVL